MLALYAILLYAILPHTLAVMSTLYVSITILLLLLLYALGLILKVDLFTEYSSMYDWAVIKDFVSVSHLMRKQHMPRYIFISGLIKNSQHIGTGLCTIYYQYVTTLWAYTECYCWIVTPHASSKM